MGSSPSPSCEHGGEAEVAPRCLGSAAMVSSVSAVEPEQQIVDHRFVLIGDRGDLCRQVKITWK